MVKKRKCYWCGQPAQSKEHVPSKTLFPEAKRINLITVPACENHNEACSDLDTRFSFYIQATAESPDSLEVFIKRTVEGLKKPEAQKFTASLAKWSTWIELDGQKRLMFSVDARKQEQYFEKIIRGLYFHLYKRPSGGRVVSVSRNFMVPNFNYDQMLQFLKPYLYDPDISADGFAQNPDIFKYHYAKLETDGHTSFAVLMTFYGKVEVLGIITQISRSA